jgi:hypothetical protein
MQASEKIIQSFPGYGNVQNLITDVDIAIARQELSNSEAKTVMQSWRDYISRSEQDDTGTLRLAR